MSSQQTEHHQVRFQTPPGSTEIVLVRHGASAPFTGVPFPLVDGHGDPPLAPEGHEQAELMAQRLAKERIDAIYVTSLTRTHQTAEPLARRLGLVPVVERDLREIYLGEWEGGLVRQMAADGHPAYLAARETGDWGAIPGAETNEELRLRCVGAIERIRERHVDQRVVCVVHGGVIASLCAHAIGAKAWSMLGADNCSIHHLVINDDGWILRCFNDTSHLGTFTTM